MDREKQKLNREKRRKLKRIARKASKEALEKMDEGLYNIFKAPFEVKVKIVDEEEKS